MSVIKEMLSDGVQKAIDGNISALEFYCQLSDIEKHIKLCKEAVNNDALIEARNYGKGEISLHGFKINVRSSAGSWKFDGIEKWNKAKEELKKIEELAKTTYNLKGKGLNVIDENAELVDGATYTPGKETLFIEVPKL